MNKNIKRLIESLFDDDYDDIIDDNDISQNSEMISDEIFTTDIFNPLLDIIEKDFDDNCDLRQYLSIKDKLTDLSTLANALGGFGYFHKIIINKNNANAFKQLFDILNIYNIPLNIKILEIQLESTENPISISEFIDLSIYDNALNIINELRINSCKLKNFKGFPNNINISIDFNNVTCIETMQGFPLTKYNLVLRFNNSVFPYDWSGCPNKLQAIFFNCNYDCSGEDIFFRELKKYIGKLYNIPSDLTFELNKLSNSCAKGFNIYVGKCSIRRISHNIEEMCIKYIGTLLKK